MFLTGLPGLYYRLIKTDRTRARWPTRICGPPTACPRRRASASDVPVPVTTFAPIAAGGVNQQPITSFNYRNIGVNIDITPRLHHDDDVSLALKLEVSSISGDRFRRPADVRHPRRSRPRSGCATARRTCSPA